MKTPATIRYEERYELTSEVAEGWGENLNEDTNSSNDNLLRFREEVLSACRISDRLYVVNPFLPRQNFYSQQLRGLALAAELKSRVLRPGKRNVCIVGASVSGKTISAAMLSLGANVTLIDRSQKPFDIYANSIHREIHPNVILWPIQKPLPATILPFLNWCQGSASEIVRSLESEWEVNFKDRLNEMTAEVVSVSENSEGVEVKLQSGDSLQTDLCILATGFSKESTSIRRRTPSYWSTDAVSTERTSVLVSGVGDGGLIDALAPFLGPHVTKVANEVALELSGTSAVEDIIEAERNRAEKKRPDGNDSDDPCTFYSSFALDSATSEIIGKSLPSANQLNGKKVTLIYRGASAYSYSAAPINKLLISHFSRPPMKLIDHRRGQIRESESGTIELLDENGNVLDGSIESAFDSIVIRHGAAASVLNILSTEQIANLKDSAYSCADLSELAEYDTSLFYWSERGLGKLRISRMSIRKMVLEAISKISRTYGMNIVVGRIPVDTPYSRVPWEADVEDEDRDRVHRLGLFPLRIGPATVVLKPRSLTREM